jgi:L-asparagine transporter-like permease
MAEASAGDRGERGEQGHLQPGLKRRHMTMIALGGIIGAGLFVGTGPILNQAGPATILTYLLTGTILILVMRMLGEMATAQPSVGSFSDYSRMALGNWAGFSIGWLYWYFWAIVVGTSFAYVSVVIYYFFPENVFTWLINASGAIALFVYLLIAISELLMRRRLERESPERLQIRMWFYPWLTYLSIAAMAAVLVAMYVIPDQRPLLIASLIALAVILAAYLLRRQFGPPEGDPQEAAER